MEMKQVHWLDVRALFTDEDVAKMAEIGLDLTSRSAVADDAQDILDRVSRHGPGRMPRPPRAPWPAASVSLFAEWMKQGFPD